MSPYEHGEVFVTDDGAETDLDLGHYERFINENLTKNSSVTMGRIYSNVIEKEIASYVPKHIKKHGILVITGVAAQEVLGDDIDFYTNEDAGIYGI